MDTKDYIYLDYNATTPLCEEAVLAMNNYVSKFGRESIERRGNANSLYEIGRCANQAIEEARASVARCLGANRPTEIAFTSGATESIFLALSGLFIQNNCTHIITTSIEHATVISAAKFLASKSQIIIIDPDRDGFIARETLLNAISSTDRALVSIGHVNSEIGSIQNISELAKAVKEKGCIFHTDMTQAVGKVSVDLEELGVDSASFSSHKFCGPTGVGGLYINRKTKFKSPIVGGGQENGMRGGTQNVAGIVAMASALKAACDNLDDECNRLICFKRYLEEKIPTIKGEAGACKITMGKSTRDDYLPNLVHVILPKIESEVAILRFDELGICVSGGSACSSHSLEPSRTLKAISIPDDEALCALRISFGRYTEKEDIERFLDALEKVVTWKS